MVALQANARTVYEDGQTTTVDDTVNDFIEVFDDFSGLFPQSTTVFFETGANITGEFDDDTVYVADTSTVIINGGNFSNDVTADFFATMIINGGVMNDDVNAFENAYIEIHGGSIADDVFAFTDGSGLPTIRIFGGTFGEDIETVGGVIEISGGTIAAKESANGGLYVDEFGLIQIEGSDFSIDGSPVGLGFVTPLSGLLSGTLGDGTAFTDVPFDRDPSGDEGSGVILLVPEPTSLAAFGLGGLCLMARRRR